MLLISRAPIRLIGILGFLTTFHASAVENLGDPYGHLASDQLTVFGFSQTDPGQAPQGVADPQVMRLLPDINIRAHQKWAENGLQASDYDFSLVDVYHQKHIIYIGGGTAAALFPSEGSETEFRDMATRDALNELVDHGNGRHNGSLANPKFRDHLFNYIKLQIDGGVDGVFLDEINGAGCSGGEKWRWNGNECFDDYFLADFNRYLLAKYPEFSPQDWRQQFAMESDNIPDKRFPVEDLTNNFNYREYLQTKGFANQPLSSENPLAAEWGRIISNRMVPYFGGFLEQAFVGYWQDLVVRIRDYARVNYGKEIYVSSNGIIPFVDFNSLGMYDYNVDNNGEEVPYVPVENGHLQGSVSLQTHFRTLKAYSEAVSNGAPLVLFIDWPTQMMLDYESLPASEREDFWRIYVAEAYANGIFYALHLKTSIDSFATAEALGLMPFFEEYAHFYRRHSGYYHHAVLSAATVQLSAENISSSITQQESQKRMLVHLNNHNYQQKMLPVKDLQIGVPLSHEPLSVTMVSPDFNGRKILPFQYTNGVVNLQVDELQFYNIIEISWAPRHSALHCNAAAHTWPQGVSVSGELHNKSSTTVNGWRACFSFTAPPKVDKYWNLSNVQILGNTVCGLNSAFNSQLLEDSRLVLGLKASFDVELPLAAAQSPWLGCSAEPIVPKPNESLSCEYELISDWQDGFAAVVSFRNVSDEPVNGWDVSFTSSQALEIAASWSTALEAQSSNTFVAKSREWNGYLAVGESQQFGFTALKSQPGNAVSLHFSQGDCLSNSL